MYLLLLLDILLQQLYNKHSTRNNFDGHVVMLLLIKCIYVCCLSVCVCASMGGKRLFAGCVCVWYIFEGNRVYSSRLVSKASRDALTTASLTIKGGSGVITFAKRGTTMCANNVVNISANDACSGLK